MPNKAQTSLITQNEDAKALLSPKSPCEVHKALHPRPVPKFLCCPQHTQPRALLPSPPLGVFWRHLEEPRSDWGCGTAWPKTINPSPVGSWPMPAAGDGLGHEPKGDGDHPPPCTWPRWPGQAGPLLTPPPPRPHFTSSLAPITRAQHWARSERSGAGSWAVRE